MEDIAEKRLTTERKLEKELGSIAKLKEGLDRSNTMTTAMLGVLNTFQERLHKLETTILPVYQATRLFQMRQENIEKVLAAIDNAVAFYNVANDVEHTIHHKTPRTDLQQYFEAMLRLKHAIDYFTAHQPECPELTAVQQLFAVGKAKIEKDFEELLSHHSNPLPPITILNMLEDDEDTSVVSGHANGSSIVLDEYIPRSARMHLEDVSHWIVDNLNTVDFLQAYATLRSHFLVRSLQGLKEHQRSMSGGSGTMALAMGSNSSATVSSPGGAVMPQLSNSSLKSVIRSSGRESLGSANGGASTPLAGGTSLGKKLFPGQQKLLKKVLVKSGEGGMKKEDESDVFEIDAYMTCILALLKLFQCETELLQSIIPEKNHKKIFDSLVQQSLDVIVLEGEQLAASTRKAASKYDFQAVLSIFPVVGRLRSLQPQYDAALERCEAPTRSKLASLISMLDSVGAKVLEQFTESIRADPDKASNMPVDGTVHELTRNSMRFLSNLKEYAEIAGAMLMTQVDPGNAGQDSHRNVTKLADYMTRVLSALHRNLTSKSETYGDEYLGAIFLMNNHNYILKTLKREELLELINKYNPDVESFYNDQILRSKKKYSESFSRVMHYLLEVDKPMSLQRTVTPDMMKLSEKDKQNVKDKFTGFNKELEDICKIQKGYAVPDPELRELLKKDNMHYVLPAYQIFHDKYAKVNFTKNVKKYLKYTSEDVGKMLQRFFDVTS